MIDESTLHPNAPNGFFKIFFVDVLSSFVYNFSRCGDLWRGFDLLFPQTIAVYSSAKPLSA